MAGKLLGLEIEMALASKGNGYSSVVNQYFAFLAQLKFSQNFSAQPYFLNGTCVGIKTPVADCGLDNGFNLLETSLLPQEGGANGLNRLAALAHKEVSDSLQALSFDDLTIINASQHPCCSVDHEWYSWARVARPIYNELVNKRKWWHAVGIDAKAQNGVNISVPVTQATDALNIVIGLSAATIALFANSPLESGKVTGLKENRLTIWPRMFGKARFAGDYYLQQYPDRPFHSIANYFAWMFGPGTVSRSLPISSSAHYKDSSNVLLDKNLCLHDFLHSRGSSATCTSTGARVFVKPCSSHFVYSQIAMFLDARLRYTLSKNPSVKDLLRAWKTQDGLEHLFQEYGASCYIECRAAGANFADNKLLSLAGKSVASSVLMAPMALQLGVLRCADGALELIQKWGWGQLGQLRSAAIKHGLEHPDVARLCDSVLELARSGLDAHEEHWLDYALYNAQTRSCSADRLLDTWNRAQRVAAPAERMQYVIQRHAALDPLTINQ